MKKQQANKIKERINFCFILEAMFKKQKCKEIKELANTGVTSTQQGS
jgi:hypothetical protein